MSINMYIKGGLFSFALTFALTSPVHAFENEPDGFRGLKWGDSASLVDDLIQNQGTQNWLKKESASVGVDLMGFPLVSYVRKSDKLDFNQVELKNITYLFYQDKLINVSLAYFDAAGTSEGRTWTNQYPKLRPAPKGYDSSIKIDEALEKYFGKPKDQSYFAKLANGGHYVYKGSITNISNSCERNAEYSCRLIFETADNAEHYKAALDSYIALMQSQKKAEAKRLSAEKEAASKAKPDF